MFTIVCLGAALGNPLPHDIKHILRNDIDINHILIDKCKLHRAKRQVKTGIFQASEYSEPLPESCFSSKVLKFSSSSLLNSPLVS